MAERDSKIDARELVAELERETERVINGTGYGVVTLEIIIQQGKPQTTRCGGIQTKKI